MEASTEKPGSTYPNRPPFWAMKLIRLLSKTCAAQDISPTGFALLSIIATTEDAAGYRRPVGFFDANLTERLGVSSQKTLADVRRKCVEHGWLHYESGRKMVAGRYWTTIPDHANGLDDFPSDEGAEYSQQMPRKNYAESGNANGTEKESIGNDATGQRANILPIPSPEPNTLIPIGSAQECRASKRFTLWRNAKREEFDKPENVQRVFERAVAAGICTADERFHVFRLVACLIDTTGPKYSLPGVITKVLRGEAGKDPWRARGNEKHEQTARKWIKTLDVPPEKQTRTANLMNEEDLNLRKQKQLDDFKRAHNL